MFRRNFLSGLLTYCTAAFTFHKVESAPIELKKPVGWVVDGPNGWVSYLRNDRLYYEDHLRVANLTAKEKALESQKKYGEGCEVYAVYK